MPKKKWTVKREEQATENSTSFEVCAGGVLFTRLLALPYGCRTEAVNVIQVECVCVLMSCGAAISNLCTIGV
jgi:hypothetical protein